MLQVTETEQYEGEAVHWIHQANVSLPRLQYRRQWQSWSLFLSFFFKPLWFNIDLCSCRHCWAWKHELEAEDVLKNKPSFSYVLSLPCQICLVLQWKQQTTLWMCFCSLQSSKGGRRETPTPTAQKGVPPPAAPALLWCAWDIRRQSRAFWHSPVASWEEFAGNVNQKRNRRETMHLRQDQDLLNGLWEMLCSLSHVKGGFEQLWRCSEA